MLLDQLDSFLVTAGLAVFLQDIAHGAQKLRPWVGFFDRIEQGQQFETHLPAAKGEGLDDNDIWLCLVEGFEKQVAAP